MEGEAGRQGAVRNSRRRQSARAREGCVLDRARARGSARGGTETETAFRLSLLAAARSRARRARAERARVPRGASPS